MDIRKTPLCRPHRKHNESLVAVHHGLDHEYEKEDDEEKLTGGGGGVGGGGDHDKSLSFLQLSLREKTNDLVGM